MRLAALFLRVGPALPITTLRLSPESRNARSFFPRLRWVNGFRTNSAPTPPRRLARHGRLPAVAVHYYFYTAPSPCAPKRTQRACCALCCARACSATCAHKPMPMRAQHNAPRCYPALGAVMCPALCCTDSFLHAPAPVLHRACGAVHSTVLNASPQVQVWGWCAAQHFVVWHCAAFSP